jgi:hypothetical protein
MGREAPAMWVVGASLFFLEDFQPNREISFGFVADVVSSSSYVGDGFLNRPK